MDGPSYTREMKRTGWILAGSVVVLVILAFLLGLLF